MVKKKKKKKGYAAKAAATLRGGFAPAAGWARTGARAAWRSVEKDAKNALKKTANEFGTDLKKTASALMGAKMPTAAEVKNLAGKIIVGTVYSVASDAVAGGLSGRSAFTQSEGQKVRSIGHATSTLKTYFTKFESGTPVSSANRNIGKDNGMTKEVLINTNLDSLDYGSGTAGRNYLTLNTGFNQKLLFIPNLALWSTNRFTEPFNLTTYAARQDKQQVNYVATQKLGRTITLMNTGRFIKQHVTIKLYRTRNIMTPPRTAFIESFASDLLISQVQDTIPKKYQLKVPFNQGTAGCSGCIVAPNGSITNASHWQARMELAKTFKKTLEPGEIWNWTEIFHTGGGLNLDVLTEMLDTQSATALGYTPVIEVHGPKVLGCYAAITDENFIGTAPSYVQMEVKLWHETAQAARRTADGWGADQATGGGIATDKYAVRSFTKFDKDPTKIFNVDVNNILDTAPDGTGAAGKLFIPVMSDTSIQYAERAREGGTGGQ